MRTIRTLLVLGFTLFLERDAEAKCGGEYYVWQLQLDRVELVSGQGDIAAQTELLGSDAELEGSTGRDTTSTGYVVVRGGVDPDTGDVAWQAPLAPRRPF